MVMRIKMIRIPNPGADGDVRRRGVARTRASVAAQITLGWCGHFDKLLLIKECMDSGEGAWASDCRGKWLGRPMEIGETSV